MMRYCLRLSVILILSVGLILVLQYARQSYPIARTRPGTAVQASPVTGSSPDAQVSVPSGWVGLLATELARRGPVAQELRTVATVVPDEEKVVHVHTRVAGWIEELYVATTGALVEQGQPLAAIYSQELFASQVEYLSVLARSGAGSSIASGARRRLQVLGMTNEEIAAIALDGEPRRLVTIVAPRRGVVLSRPVAVGAAVDPSTQLLTIADLSTVWVLAEVPERSVPSVTVGMPVSLDLPAWGIAPVEARVDFLYPTLSERTRSLRVRIILTNPEDMLRPGLSGTARFQLLSHEGLLVPRDAVVDSGAQQYVFVRTGEDAFSLRNITPGVRMPDYIEVLAGLTEGEEVLASGVFLLDSESRLRSSGAAGLGHGSHGSSGVTPEAATHEGHQDASP